MVSPYLLRRVRTLEEVARTRSRVNPLDAVVRRALAEAKAAGKGPHDQINRAAMAVLELNPELSPLDALAAVQRVRRKTTTDSPR